MFYDIFEDLCRSKRIAPSALTRKLGMSASAPGRWKTGSLPDLETAIKIADFFGVSIDYLVRGSDWSQASASNVSGGAAVVQGSHGNTVSVSSQGNDQSDLHGFEAELIRIYRGLGMREKMAMMQHAYDLEEGKGDTL